MAACISGWVTMPAPRDASASPARSQTITSQPARCSSRPAKSPPMDPPATIARGPPLPFLPIAALPPGFRPVFAAG